MGEKFTFKNKVQMQMEVSNMVDLLNRYYSSLVENINANTFSDDESSWMAERKEEFDERFVELKENIEYISKDLESHIKQIYSDEINNITQEEYEEQKNQMENQDEE